MEARDCCLPQRADMPARRVARRNRTCLSLNRDVQKYEYCTGCAEALQDEVWGVNEFNDKKLKCVRVGIEPQLRHVAAANDESDDRHTRNRSAVVSPLASQPHATRTTPAPTLASAAFSPEHSSLRDFRRNVTRPRGQGAGRPDIVPVPSSGWGATGLGQTALARQFLAGEHATASILAGAGGLSGSVAAASAFRQRRLANDAAAVVVGAAGLLAREDPLGALVRGTAVVLG